MQLEGGRCDSDSPPTFVHPFSGNRLPPAGGVSDQMDNEAHEQRKQERIRTRWTASLDKIFADLVVQQVQSGSRRNNVFDKKTWNHIRNEFNKQTELSFNNNQLRKHLDVLRTRYYNIKSASDQNDFAIDDSFCIGFDLWEDKKPETPKMKDCPIFEQLCTIFADSEADGRYAQSSHYEELDKRSTESPTDPIAYPESEAAYAKAPFSKVVQSKAENTGKNKLDRKRKLTTEPGSSSAGGHMDQEINKAMAEAMLEMVNASKLHRVAMPQQRDERFTISNCIKVLDEIEGIDDHLYYYALDLFEDPNLREMFVSLRDNNIRLTWLHGKYSGNITSTG